MAAARRSANHINRGNMLRQLLTFIAPATIAAFAIVTVASTDAAAPTLSAAPGGDDVQLGEDQAQNMSYPPIGPPPKPPCEAVWTCDWETFYPNRSACAAACGGPANCAQDFNCDGTCICP